MPKTETAPPAPAKPLSAYGIFQQSLGLSGRWAELDDADKQVYVQRHADETENYKVQLEEYKRAVDAGDEAAQKPKKPLAPFFAWLQEQRVGEQWSSLSDDDRAKFEAEATRAKAEYKTAIEEYNAAYGTAAERALEAPPPPKKYMGSFMHFVTKNRSEFKSEYADLSFTEVNRKMGNAWNDLDDDEKAEYVEMERADRERYDTELAEYTARWGDPKFIKKEQKKQKAQLQKLKVADKHKEEREKERDNARKQREKLAEQKQKEKEAKALERERKKAAAAKAKEKAKEAREKQAAKERLRKEKAREKEAAKRRKEAEKLKKLKARAAAAKTKVVKRGRPPAVGGGGAAAAAPVKRGKGIIGAPKPAKAPRAKATGGALVGKTPKITADAKGVVFKFYAADVQAKKPALSSKEVRKIAAGKWEKMSDAARLKVAKAYGKQRAAAAAETTPVSDV